MLRDLQASERDALRLAPLWVLDAVAGRHTRFSDLELASFWRAVEDAMFACGGLTRDLLADLYRARQEVVAHFEADPRPVASGLRQVRAALSRLAPDEVETFTGAVLRIGVQVARERGPYGKVVSPENGQTLQLLAALLDTDLSPSALGTPVG